MQHLKYVVAFASHLHRLQTRLHCPISKRLLFCGFPKFNFTSRLCCFVWYYSFCCIILINIQSILLGIGSVLFISFMAIKNCIGLLKWMLKLQLITYPHSTVNVWQHFSNWIKTFGWFRKPPSGYCWIYLNWSFRYSLAIYKRWVGIISFFFLMLILDVYLNELTIHLNSRKLLSLHLYEDGHRFLGKERWIKACC